MSSTSAHGPALRTFGPARTPLQPQAAVAVVMTTILRPSLERALASVYAQNLGAPIHMLIGVDQPQGSWEMLEAIGARAPSHCRVQALWPGYSTSARHGGLWPARDGGTLRTVLSYLANAPLIAYLDDDNWWAANHLSSLARAIEPAEWAWSLRLFVHPATRRAVCVDDWESVGPDAGIFQPSFGGFVDPNCLMIRRAPCAGVIPWWTVPLPNDAKGMSADRHVFDFLRRRHKGAGTGQATAFYVVDERDEIHPHRLARMGEAYERAGSP